MPVSPLPKSPRLKPIAFIEQGSKTEDYANNLYQGNAQKRINAGGSVNRSPAPPVQKNYTDADFGIGENILPTKQLPAVDYNSPPDERNLQYAKRAAVNASNRQLRQSGAQQANMIRAENSAFGGPGNSMFVSNNPEQLATAYDRNSTSPTMPGAFTQNAPVQPVQPMQNAPVQSGLPVMNQGSPAEGNAQKRINASGSVNRPAQPMFGDQVRLPENNNLPSIPDGDMYDNVNVPEFNNPYTNNNYSGLNNAKVNKSRSERNRVDALQQDTQSGEMVARLNRGTEAMREVNNLMSPGANIITESISGNSNGYVPISSEGGKTDRRIASAERINQNNTDTAQAKSANQSETDRIKSANQAKADMAQTQLNKNKERQKQVNFDRGFSADTSKRMGEMFNNPSYLNFEQELSGIKDPVAKEQKTAEFNKALADKGLLPFNVYQDFIIKNSQQSNNAPLVLNTK